MSAARIRLILAALLVAGWFSYLGYLALAKEPAVVVPRPQLLAATHIVKAKLVFNKGIPVESAQFLKGDGHGLQIDVEQIKDARMPGSPGHFSDGEYLLLLEEITPGHYRFAGNPKGSYVYPWTPEVERQVRAYVSP